MKIIIFCAVFAAMLTACSAPATVSVQVSPTSTKTAAVSTVTPTSVPTEIPTVVQVSLSTPVLPTVTPTSALSPAQICEQLAGKAERGLYVIELEPIPDLVWDNVPREFQVGVCNTLTVSTVPAGEFMAFVFLPGSAQAIGQTTPATAQLEPGYHALTLKSWTPGYENHVTACATRPYVQVRVDYADSPRTQNFRPVSWLDGNDRVVFPVKCGGNFP